MHEGQRGCKARIVQVLIVVAELIGEEHALVNDGPAGHANRVEVILRAQSYSHAIGDDAPSQVKLALERLLIFDPGWPPHKDLPMYGLRCCDRFWKRAVANRYVPPAENGKPFLDANRVYNGFAFGTKRLILRQKELTNTVKA